MAVRVGWWLSALAVVSTLVAAIIALLDHHVTDLGGLNVAGTYGLTWLGVLTLGLAYWLAPALVVIWVGVLAAVAIGTIAQR